MVSLIDGSKPTTPALADGRRVGVPEMPAVPATDAK